MEFRRLLDLMQAKVNKAKAISVVENLIRFLSLKVTPVVLQFHSAYIG